MEFQPIRAAGVFTLAVYSPMILATSVISAWPPLAQGAIAGCVAASWFLFFLGARLARLPHSTKSLIFSVLLTWSFTFSTGGIATYFAPSSGLWLNALQGAASLAFVFLGGWRLAPRTVVAVHG
jgi:hypothetical protein